MNKFDALSNQKENDRKFLTEIITLICDYAVDNNMNPNYTMQIIASNILMIEKIADFKSWVTEEDSESK